MEDLKITEQQLTIVDMMNSEIKTLIEGLKIISGMLEKTIEEIRANQVTVKTTYPERPE